MEIAVKKYSAFCSTMGVIAIILFSGTNSLAGKSGNSQFEPVMTDDGLLTQPWFLNSFLDLNEDHAEARANGKTFAIIWELKGCPYCKVLHTTNLARPETQNLARSKFEILQLNILGSRKVTDFDGEELTEKQLAKKHRVRFTPSMQFFAKKVSDKRGAKNEVARMAGYYQPFHFYSLLQFVSTGAYANTKFRKYLRNEHGALKARGATIESW